MVYNELLDFNLTRSDLIITLGGGVIGDLGGFVASSYLRGIDFIQVPTSLLEVDSSVGGKVAVDLERGKNLVGSFYHPKAVLIDPEVLNTLDNRFFIDGMAEVIKYGCIKDKMFFEFLYEMENNSDVIDNMERVIHKCCDIKRIVVESDEKDKGERMLLNFGHTLGHAIEQYYNYTKYTHGEAVAIGMYEITKISEAKGLTVKGTAERIKEILIKYNLPYKMDVNIEEILDTINLDKKKLGKSLNLIILKEIGNSEIYKTTTEFFI
ncbi:putative 3-dehydroquinate synthase [Clostridium celatum DSM 1785]|uniref:3-dehydroquinate synthase n=1 Tax=Clostridium celatum DSM 1785 TaxID=545697 RepID=L1QEK2_9CLOT|nr:putative 3-dehydroquinate synthase [Clostridium celatum DSM 1785]